MLQSSSRAGYYKSQSRTAIAKQLESLAQLDTIKHVVISIDSKTIYITWIQLFGVKLLTKLDEELKVGINCTFFESECQPAVYITTFLKLTAITDGYSSINVELSLCTK